jgi:ABC-2 type transport system permease protein
MSAMTTIAKREFRSYFDSPVAYVVICLSFLGLGLMFFQFEGGFWGEDRASLENLFQYMPPGLAMLVVPVVTMGLIAEEKRSGTLEMLITLPVRDSDVVLGKYFGALGLVLTLLASTIIYPIAMFKTPWMLGSLDMGPVQTAYLGLVLFSAAAVAIGLLVSSLTDSQAVSFFITFFILIVLWYMGRAADWTAGPVGEVIRYVSFDTRISSFMRGLVETRDVIYFLSITCLCLIIAFRKLESRKWA